MRLSTALPCSPRSPRPRCPRLPSRLRPDRCTAVWVGDRFEYVVRVEYQPELEFVKDHLKKDEIDLKPFEILAAATATGNAAARPHRTPPATHHLRRRRHRDRHPSDHALLLQAGPRFRQRGRPAEAINIPAFPMAVRNTVIDASLGIRDQRPPLPIDRMSWIVPGMLGLCGLAAIAIGGGRIALAQFRLGVWEQKLAERSRTKSLQQSMEESLPHAGRDAARIGGFLRQSLRDSTRSGRRKTGRRCGTDAQRIETRADCRRRSRTPCHQSFSELLAQCDLDSPPTVCWTRDAGIVGVHRRRARRTPVNRPCTLLG